MKCNFEWVSDSDKREGWGVYRCKNGCRNQSIHSPHPAKDIHAGCGDPETARGPCVHLGKATKDTIKCTTCNGNVRIRLFECELHKRCSIKKPVGFQCCWNCPDHEEK